MNISSDRPSVPGPVTPSRVWAGSLLAIKGLPTHTPFTPTRMTFWWCRVSHYDVLMMPRITLWRSDDATYHIVMVKVQGEYCSVWLRDGWLAPGSNDLQPTKGTWHQIPARPWWWHGSDHLLLDSLIELNRFTMWYPGARINSDEFKFCQEGVHLVDRLCVTFSSLFRRLLKVNTLEKHNLTTDWKRKPTNNVIHVLVMQSWCILDRSYLTFSQKKYMKIIIK